MRAELFLPFHKDMGIFAIRQGLAYAKHLQWTMTELTFVTYREKLHRTFITSSEDIFVLLELSHLRIQQSKQANLLMFYSILFALWKRAPVFPSIKIKGSFRSTGSCLQVAFCPHHLHCMDQIIPPFAMDAIASLGLLDEDKLGKKCFQLAEQARSFEFWTISKTTVTAQVCCDQSGPRRGPSPEKLYCTEFCCC